MEGGLTVSALNQFDEEFSSAGEVITRDQFYARAQRIKTPEDRLLLQVLILALSDAQLGGMPAAPKRAEVSREAYQWIMSDDSGLMSCRMICDALEIDLAALRGKLAGSFRIRSRHSAA